MPKKNNVVNLFRSNETVSSVTELLESAVKEADENAIINCMLVMVDDDDTITYSYANFYRKVTMIGAIEKLKHIYIEDDTET